MFFVITVSMCLRPHIISHCFIGKFGINLFWQKWIGDIDLQLEA